MSSPARFPEKEATPPLPSPPSPLLLPLLSRERLDADTERAQIIIRNYCPRDIEAFLTVRMWEGKTRHGLNSMYTGENL